MLGGYPPNAGPTWFISVHHAGTANTAKDNDDFIREQYRFEVVPWVRSTAFPRDRSGKLLLHSEQYREATGKTLSKLERQVIQSLQNGSARYDFVTILNTLIDSDTATYGNCVTQPLRYAGTGGYEEYTSDDQDFDGSTDPEQWLGIRISFVGLERTQSFTVVK